MATENGSILLAKLDLIMDGLRLLMEQQQIMAERMEGICSWQEHTVKQIQDMLEEMKKQ